jgi:hypothetical protein
MEMEEQPVSAKRGWRFHGTFGTLALLNFICAIDATILSVALPVRDYSNRTSSLLIRPQDNSYGFERHHCYPSFLGWDFVSLVSSRQPPYFTSISTYTTTGHWIRHRSSHRWRSRGESHLAMDFLAQYSILCDRCYRNPYLSQAVYQGRVGQD